VKAGLDHREPHSGPRAAQASIDLIRADLEGVKARQTRTRAISTPSTPTQTVYYRPVNRVVSPVLVTTTSVPFATSVTPPPPIPPVSSELTARIDKLEEQRVSIEDACEQRVQQLKAELHAAQVSALQGQMREVEVEQNNAEWKERLQTLETRMRAEQGAAVLRVEEAMRQRAEELSSDSALRWQSERERLLADLQAAREALRRAEEQQRRFHDDAERLRGELLGLRSSEQSACAEAQRGQSAGERAQEDLRQLRAEARRLSERLAAAERRAQDVTLELEGEKASSRQAKAALQEQRAAGESRLNQARAKIEELRRHLAEAEAARDVASTDLAHLRKANGLRAQEAQGLRQALQEEARTVEILQLQVEALKDAEPPRPAAPPPPWRKVDGVSGLCERSDRGLAYARARAVFTAWACWARSERQARWAEVLEKRVLHFQQLTQDGISVATKHRAHMQSTCLSLQHRAISRAALALIRLAIAMWRARACASRRWRLHLGELHRQRVRACELGDLQVCFFRWKERLLGSALVQLQQRLDAACGQEEELQRDLDRKTLQLQDMYRQLDQVTGTLEKELETKEELAGELRAAYEQSRQARKTETLVAETMFVETTHRCAAGPAAAAPAGASDDTRAALAAPQAASRQATAKTAAAAAIGGGLGRVPLDLLPRVGHPGGSSLSPQGLCVR